MKNNQPELPQYLDFKLDQGLSTAEVETARRQHGFNEIPEKRANPALLFLRRFWGLTPWMLELTALLTWILHHELETLVVLGLLVFNGALGFIQEARTNAALDYLKRRLQVSARVKRDGKWTVVPARELVSGDVVRLRAGDFVPADAKVLHGSLEVDQSGLTGESLPVDKTAGETVFSGSLVRRWEATCSVTATGTRTYYGRTVELVHISKPKLHMEEVIAQVVKRLLAMVGVLILAGIAVTAIRGEDVIALLTLSVVLLVSAIPVALPTMFTISMALGSLALAKKGVLITRLSAGEDAATMDVLCADKTGTITLNKLSTAEIRTVGSHSKEDVVRLACLASQEANRDPIDEAIFATGKEMRVTFDTFAQKDFVPFDPATRMTQATVEHEGRSFLAWKGSVGAVSTLVNPAPEIQAEVAEELKHVWEKGYRAIAVATGTSEDHRELAGIIALTDRPRPESAELMRELKELGIEVKMLTGDALPIARETATEVGMGTDIVSVSALKRGGESDIIEETDGFAEVYPEDKHLIVKTLQGRGHIVGMTGDGVNDAPALRQAEVGIAVSSATDVARSSASVVLTKEGFSGIVDLVKGGRMIHQRIVTWIMNKVVKTFQVVVFVVLAFLLTGEFAVSVLSMILFLFVTDFVTLSLSTDIARPSKNPETWDVKGQVRIAVLLGILTVAESFLLLFAGFSVFDLRSDLGHLQTFVFAYLVFLGVLNVLTLRERGHFWESRPSNALVLFIVADIVVVTLLSMIGLPGLPAIPITEIVVALAFSLATCFLVNDFVKVTLMRSVLPKRSDSFQMSN